MLDTAFPDQGKKRVKKERRYVGRIPLIVAEPDHPRGIVVFFHGAGASKERTARLAAPFHATGMLTIHPDAPYHGERQGGEDPLKARHLIVKAIEESMKEFPALAAWARKTYGPLPLGVVGASMGGYVVHALLASGFKFEAAAVFISSAETPAWLRGHLPPDHVDPIDRAASYPPTPLLHVHGAKDRVVPIASMERTIEALKPAYAGEPGKLAKVIFPHLGHEVEPEMVAIAAAWFWTWLASGLA